MKEKIVAAIIENTVPQNHLGVWMYHEFGIRPSFALDGNILVFQAAIKMHLTERDTKKRLFNFITATNFKMEKTINDEGFYELANSFILAAIADFNTFIKKEKSTFLIGITYPENISFEKNKEAIRKAWTVYQFGQSSSNN